MSRIQKDGPIFSQPLEQQSDSGSSASEAEEDLHRYRLGATAISSSVTPCVKKSGSLKEGEEIYPLSKGLKRGKLLVANFEHFTGPHKYGERKGSDFDVENLKNVFSQIGKKG